MKSVTGKKFYVLLGFFVVFLMVAMLFNTTLCMASVLNGLSVWLNSVVPALFPFLFLTKLFTNLNMVELVAKKFEKPTKKLFNVSGIGSYVFLMSLLSGYPVGSKLVSELFLSGKITKIEAERMCSFCSTSGPIFVVGTVGSAMFLDATLGMVILISHILGTFLNGFLFRFYKKNDNQKIFSSHQKQKNVDGILANTMYDSIISILMIGGFITIFFVVLDLLFQFHVLSFLSSAISGVLNFFGIDENVSTAITSGLFEVTRGCKELSIFASNKILTAVIACGLVSFGGLSIHLQSLAFLQKCKIKIGLYFLMKTTQSIFAMIFAFCLAILIF